MNITVKIQNVYGKETIYPACEVSRDLLALTGKKTFSARDIETIKRLGYLVGVATPTLAPVWHPSLEKYVAPSVALRA